MYFYVKNSNTWIDNMSMLQTNYHNYINYFLFTYLGVTLFGFFPVPEFM